MRNTFIYFSLLILFASCGKGVLFSEYKSIPTKDGWHAKDRIVFELDVTDTVTRYDYLVNLRQTDSYKYRNIFMFLTTEYPDGHLKLDTLECLLSDEKNRWLGEGAGDVWDNHILFKHNFHFPSVGKYKFHYEQGMRDDPLPEVIDVGLTIQKTD